VKTTAIEDSAGRSVPFGTVGVRYEAVRLVSWDLVLDYAAFMAINIW
jgi:hypothetical protein